MSNRNNAFTFLEVMIVVAIISVLSMIAIPSYKSYISNARITKIMASANNLIDQAVAYRMENGNFPTAADLGLPEDPANSGNPIYTNPTTVSPYLQSISIQDSTYGTGCSPCCVGGELTVTMILNGDALGRSDIGTVGGCGSIGIMFMTVITTDNNVRKICLTDYDASVVSANDCAFSCSTDSSNWPSTTQSQYTYMVSNRECGRSSY